MAADGRPTGLSPDRSPEGEGRSRRRSSVAWALGEDQVDIWWADLGWLAERESDVARWLSPGEWQRAARARRPAARQQLILSRGFLRVILAAYLAERPDRLRFSYGPLGKPSLASRALEFNLSHTGEAVCVAVGRRPLGVDVERVDPEVPLLGLAQRVFSSEELTAWLGLAPQARPLAFFRCWARKEAWLKAGGVGLSVPLSACPVPKGGPHLGHPLPCLPGEDGRARYQLYDLEVPRGYVGALVVRAESGAVSLCYRRCHETPVPYLS